MDRKQYKKLEIFPRITTIRQLLSKEKEEDLLQNVPDSIASLFAYGQCKLKDLTPYCIKKLKDRKETYFAKYESTSAAGGFISLFIGLVIFIGSLLIGFHMFPQVIALIVVCLIPLIIVTIRADRHPLKRGLYLYDRFLFSIDKNDVLYYELGRIQNCKFKHTITKNSVGIKIGDSFTVDFFIAGCYEPVSFTSIVERNIAELYHICVLRRLVLYKNILKGTLNDDLSKLFIIDKVSNGLVEEEPLQSSTDSTQVSDFQEQLLKPDAELHTREDFLYLLEKANGGDPVAQYNIGLAYEQGRFCEACPALGLFYLENAAEKKQQNAIELLSDRKIEKQDKLEPCLTQQEIYDSIGESLVFEKLPKSIQQRLIWRQILQQKHSFAPSQKGGSMVVVLIVAVIMLLGGGMAFASEEGLLAQAFALFSLGMGIVLILFAIYDKILTDFQRRRKNNALQDDFYLTPLYLVKTEQVTTRTNGSVSLLPLAMIKQMEVTENLRNGSYSNTEIQFHLINGETVERTYYDRDKTKGLVDLISSYREAAILAAVSKSGDILEKYDDFNLYSSDLLKEVISKTEVLPFLWTEK